MLGKASPSRSAISCAPTRSMGLILSFIKNPDLGVAYDHTDLYGVYDRIYSTSHEK